MLVAALAIGGCAPGEPSGGPEGDGGAAADQTVEAWEVPSVQRFEVREVLPQLVLELEAGGCSDDAGRLVCTGPLVIEIVADGSAETVETIEMASTYLELGDDGALETEYDGVYGSHQPVVYADDMDFDGQLDLAVRNGNNGSYYGPSYDVFLAVEAGFVRSRALSELASSGLNRPEIDPEARTWTLLDKNGCCEHYIDVYSIVGGEPIRIAGSRILEDLAGAPIFWGDAAVPGEVCGGEGLVQLADGEGLISSERWPNVWQGLTEPTMPNQVAVTARGPRVLGDVDGDGSEDTVLSVWCSNGSGMAGGQLGNGLVVFRGLDDQEPIGIITTTQDASSVGHAPYFHAGATLIGDRTIDVVEVWYREGDATAGPTGVARTSWMFVDGELVAGPTEIDTSN